MKTVSIMNEGMSPRIPSWWQQYVSWMAAIGIMILALLLCTSLWSKMQVQKNMETNPKSEEQRIVLQLPQSKDPGLNVKVIRVKNLAPWSRLSVAATVEANQRKVQQITPLVIGRVREILVTTGQKVKKGELLLVIDSPQIAEMHGKLHESETRIALAKSQLERVTQTSNQVNILKAKASLDEAETTVKRNRLLVAEGATPQKDLIASETEWRRAQAEYEFQANISLNRELAEAKSELCNAETEAKRLRDELRVLDGAVNKNLETSDHDIARIELRSPISGTVIERNVNAGSGVDTGKALLTIADTSGLWVIANVPEQQALQVSVGMNTRIQIEGKTFEGIVNFIDPRLNEDTRTAKVRIAFKDLKEPIATGSYAQVEFIRRDVDSRARAYIPESAIQDIEGKSSVFVSKTSGNFELRQVEAGPRCCNLIPIYKGLSAGEQIAEDGAFILKSELLKGKLGGVQ